MPLFGASNKHEPILEVLQHVYGPSSVTDTRLAVVQDVSYHLSLI